MRQIRLVVLTSVAVLAIAACSSSSSSAPTAAPSVAPSAATPSVATPSVAAPSVAAPSAAAPSAVASAASGDAVSLAGFAFKPPSLTVPVGATVTWTNADSATHTVTADDGSFKSDRLAPGATFRQTFATAGTFAYHCSIHPSMTGTITVH